jgi:hypothetical protein
MWLKSRKNTLIQAKKKEKPVTNTKNIRHAMGRNRMDAFRPGPIMCTRKSKGIKANKKIDEICQNSGQRKNGLGKIDFADQAPFADYGHE